MTILQIGAAFVAAQKQIEIAIHHALEKKGYTSYILYSHGSSSDPHVIRFEGRILNIIRRCFLKMFGKNPVFASLSTICLIRKIKKIQPNLVHLHVIHHGYINYTMLFKYLAKEKIPVVFTMHDMWAFTGGCYHFADISCDGYLNQCYNCPKDTKQLDCQRKKTRKYFKLKKELFEQLYSVSFVSVSSWVYEETQKSYLKKYPQYLIWNAVDSAFCIEQTSENLPSEKFKIIGVANNWSDQKGLSRFFELAKLLGDEFEIILVGNISKKIQSEAPDNIVFVGSVRNSNELAMLYASCDLHVSMSFEETFGMTFVEAAFAGIRSLGFDSTAIPGVLRQINGFVISKADVLAAVAKIRELRQNREKCRLDLEEKRYIESIFSASFMAEKYIDIYAKQISTVSDQS